MPDHHDELNASIDEIDRALKLVKRLRVTQIQNSEQRDYLRATAFSWFKSHRPNVIANISAESIKAIDDHLRAILEASERRARPSTYISSLQGAKDALIAARATALVTAAPVLTNDISPNFSTIAADLAMQGILERRWTECRKCIDGSAPLAATVMMGGLLEALFVGRANRLSDKSKLFKCSTTPIDPKTKKALDLRYWTLSSYIDVGHELGWITTAGKDVAGVLREYRNYIHPEKERSHGITIGLEDAEMFWELTKRLSRQLLAMQGVQ